MKAIFFSLALAGLCLTPATVQAAPASQTISVKTQQAIDDYLLEGNIAVLKATADYMEQTGRALSIVDMMYLSVEFAKTYPLDKLPAEYQACLREYYDELSKCLEEASAIENQDEAMEVLSEKILALNDVFAKKYPRAFRDIGPEATQRFLAKANLDDKAEVFIREHPELLNEEGQTQLMILTLRFMAEELEKMRK